jgi:hypothetical protein
MSKCAVEGQARCCLVSNELGMTCKEVAVASLRTYPSYPGICLEGLNWSVRVVCFLAEV